MSNAAVNPIMTEQEYISQKELEQAHADIETYAKELNKLNAELGNAKERIAALATDNEEIRSCAQDKIREVQQDYEGKMKAWGITCALQTFGLCKEWKIAPSFDEVAELASQYEQYAMKKETVQ